MKYKDLTVLIPKLNGDRYDEFNILGLLLRLWLRSPVHNQKGIFYASTRLRALVKSGNFAIFMKNDEPVGYISWAYFNEANELEYLGDDDVLYEPQNWNSGQHTWIIDFFTFDGVGRDVSQIMKRYLFPNEYGFSLHRRIVGEYVIINTFCGVGVDKAEFQLWKQERGPYFESLGIFLR